MTNKNRKRHIKTLRRRLNYLQKLLVDSGRTDLSYTMAEVAALEDALCCMEFYTDGFYEAITNKSLNLTIEQIDKLARAKETSSCYKNVNTRKMRS